MSKQENDKLVHPPEFDMTTFEELEELSNRVNERVRKANAKMEELRKSLEKDGLL